MAETQYLSIGLYSYPPSAFWTAAIDAVPSRPHHHRQRRLGPGTGYEANFGDIYAEAAAAGILMLGYVSTGYGGTSEADVEAAGRGLVLVLRRQPRRHLLRRSRCHHRQRNVLHGARQTTSTPTTPAARSCSTRATSRPKRTCRTPIGDIIQVEENTYANLAADAAAAPSWLFDYPTSQIAVTVNTCPTQADMTTAIGLTSSAFNAKWVWVTADDVYAAEPDYFDAEVALLTPGPTGDLTVTATQGGGDTNPGILLRVRVLDNAAVAGTPNAGTQSAAAAHSVTITTTEAGSIVYGAIVDGDDAIVPMNAGCTNLDNVVDATNDLCYATFFSGPTGTPGANSVGTDASLRRWRGRARGAALGRVNRDGRLQPRRRVVHHGHDDRDRVVHAAAGHAADRVRVRRGHGR